MANPQLENGYTRIVNELYEAVIRTDLTGREFRVFFAIIRATYGWGRKTAELSAAEFADLTHINDPSAISHLTSSLQRRNMIRKTSQWGKKCQYAVNKNHETWRLVVYDSTAQADSTVVDDNDSTVVDDNTSTVVDDNTNAQDTLLHERKSKESTKETHGSHAHSTSTRASCSDDNNNGYAPILSILKLVEGYPYEPAKDQEFIANLKADYPLVDLIEVAKSYRDWVLDHPITKKDSPRSRFRNFVRKDDQWRKEYEAKCNERGKSAHRSSGPKRPIQREEGRASGPASRIDLSQYE